MSLAGSASASQLVVRRAAPNWPAMVERKSSVEQLKRSCSRDQCLITPADASLWMRSRQLRSSVEQDSAKSSGKMSRFASKTSLVRQCLHCQILYTSCHKCALGGEEPAHAGGQQ